jgi:hypothetical protein
MESDGGADVVECNSEADTEEEKLDARSESSDEEGEKGDGTAKSTKVNRSGEGNESSINGDNNMNATIGDGDKSLGGIGKEGNNKDINGKGNNNDNGSNLNASGSTRTSDKPSKVKSALIGTESIDWSVVTLFYGACTDPRGRGRNPLRRWYLVEQIPEGDPGEDLTRLTNAFIDRETVPSAEQVLKCKGRETKLRRYKKEKKNKTNKVDNQSNSSGQNEKDSGAGGNSGEGGNGGDGKLVIRNPPSVVDGKRVRGPKRWMNKDRFSDSGGLLVVIDY